MRGSTLDSDIEAKYKRLSDGRQEKTEYAKAMRRRARAQATSLILYIASKYSE